MDTTREPYGGLKPGACPARVLHVVHGWPPHNYGGTELYAHWLATWQKARREVAVYARVADPGRAFGEATETEEDGLRVRRVVNNFHQRSPFSRNALRSPRLERDLTAFVERFPPELIHVHHLSGHALSLAERIAGLGLPFVYQVQDWWALCARASLHRPDGSLCPGPSPSRCGACLPMTALPPSTLLNRLLYRYRRGLARRCLAKADAHVMGSRAIEADYRAAGLLREGGRVYVLPYGVRLPEEVPPRSDEPSLPLRFGFVGSIQSHKGLHVMAEALRGQTVERAVLDVWGDPETDPVYTERLRELAPSGMLRLRGRFTEEEKSRVFTEMDVLVLPSLGLESFGLVAREALAYGVPVIASRQSALAELFPRDGAGGTWIEPGDVAGLRRVVDALVERPATVGEWRRKAPAVVSDEEHAWAIEQVYADVLARREESAAVGKGKTTA